MNAQSHSPKYLLLTSHILGIRCERPTAIFQRKPFRKIGLGLLTVSFTKIFAPYVAYFGNSLRKAKGAKPLWDISSSCAFPYKHPLPVFR